MRGLLNMTRRKHAIFVFILILFYFDFISAFVSIQLFSPRANIRFFASRIPTLRNASPIYVYCSLPNLESLTVSDLRTQLQKFGENPPSKLKKAELISLLAPYVRDNPAAVLPSTVSTSQISGGSLDPADIQAMTVQQLKDELKARGLRVGGTKPELTARLLEALDKKEAPGAPEDAESVNAVFSITSSGSEASEAESSDSVGAARTDERVGADGGDASDGDGIIDEEETTQVVHPGRASSLSRARMVSFAPGHAPPRGSSPARSAGDASRQAAAAGASLRCAAPAAVSVGCEARSRGAARADASRAGLCARPRLQGATAGARRVFLELRRGPAHRGRRERVGESEREREADRQRGRE